GKIEELLRGCFEIGVQRIEHLKIERRNKESSQTIAFDYNEFVALDLFSDRWNRIDEFAFSCAHPERASRSRSKKPSRVRAGIRLALLIDFERMLRSIASASFAVCGADIMAELRDLHSRPSSLGKRIDYSLNDGSLSDIARMATY